MVVLEQAQPSKAVGPHVWLRVLALSLIGSLARALIAHSVCSCPGTAHNHAGRGSRGTGARVPQVAQRSVYGANRERTRVSVPDINRTTAARITPYLARVLASLSPKANKAIVLELRNYNTCSDLNAYLC